jgi:hypothetical protein
VLIRSKRSFIETVFVRSIHSPAALIFAYACTTTSTEEADTSTSPAFSMSFSLRLSYTLPLENTIYYCHSSLALWLDLPVR